jgi:hypothetical protein
MEIGDPPHYNLTPVTSQLFILFLQYLNYFKKKIGWWRSKQDYLRCELHRRECYLGILDNIDNLRFSNNEYDHTNVLSVYKKIKA